MLNMTRDVLRNKNKIEKEEKERKRLEERKIRNFEAYRAKLYDNMKIVDYLLSCKDASSMIIEVKKEQVEQFMNNIYNDEMNEYSIVQLSYNTFKISKKVIDL